MRLYFVLPISNLSDPNAAKEWNPGNSINERASYISGQIDICGDVIFAHIGYTWRTLELNHEDLLLLHTYYRMLLNKTPDGSYKLSRKAVLAASLPNSSSTRTNWRGTFPKNLLYILPPSSSPRTSFFLIDSSKESCKRLKCLNGEEYVLETAKTASVRGCRCEIKLFSKNMELMLSYPIDSYVKEIDAVNTAFLVVFSWLNEFFKQTGEYLVKSASTTVSSCVQANVEVLCKEFALSSSKHNFQQIATIVDRPLDLVNIDSKLNIQNEKVHIPNYGLFPSTGSFGSVSYTVFLVVKGADAKEILESNDDFEFEIGTGAVISHLEDAVTQLCVGQSAHISTCLLQIELILAAVDSTKFSPHLSKCTVSAWRPASVSPDMIWNNT